tara:strand:- start:239562 stop:240029 length:468 start_codon:yes stop_codon:yes gene_type:complete
MNPVLSARWPCHKNADAAPGPAQFCYTGASLNYELELAVSDVTIYHNPRCSKSRSTLELIKSRGLEPTVVLYLETPPGAADIKRLLKQLGMGAGELVRRTEEQYKSLGLSRDSSDAQLIAAMAAHPKLIERPIVVRGKQAVLGRPPENVLELLDA